MPSYERQHRYERKKAAAAADIGEIPAVVDPARREVCSSSLLKFLETYFPASTGLSPFGADHRRAIERIQRCITDGGLFINLFPRGYAKTTISENSALWAVLYGHRRFVPIFGADSGSAAGNIDSIKVELAENELLAQDFPEVCHAVRALEGKVQRCASQTVNGKLTRIEWTADTLVLPTIEGSICSGSILTAKGIGAASRGMKHKRPDGTQQRPDFVLIDDPQTDESASTELQVNKRLDVIRKSILKLGGHGKKLAVVMNATVIKPDDLIERLLDAKKFPAWQGERIKMVKSWATANDTLWLGDYQRIRNTYHPEELGDQQRAHRDATDFYRRNRAGMDAGCLVSWDECYDRTTELSAIQHAYNALIDDGPEVFASECQNEPLRPDAASDDSLKASEIAAKLNGVERGVAPADVSRVVVFIDVQKNALYWVACGFEEGFTGHVLDYDTWPEQRGRSYFAYKDIRRTIESVTKIKTLEASIYAALDILTGELMARDWQRADGANLKVERILIDAGWGDSTDTIYKFVRGSPHAAVLMPSHGRYVGATSRPFNDYQRKTGDRAGLNWRIPSVQGRRVSRFALYDTNFYKSFVQQRLRTPAGAKGCLSLFGDEQETHRLFADHATAEKPTRVEAKGRVVVEWKLPPSRPDNHWLDGLVGCHVAASIQGVAVMQAAPVVKRRRVKYSEIQGKTWN